MMKNLFCIVLAATFAFTASLHAQDKDKDEKDKAAVKDKEDVKDKDKDKAAPKAEDKDKAAPKVETKEVVLPVETRIKIGDYLINPSVFYITGACLVAIVGVWYTLLRKKPEDEAGAPPV